MLFGLSCRCITPCLEVLYNLCPLGIGVARPAPDLFHGASTSNAVALFRIESTDFNAGCFHEIVIL